MVWSDWKTVRYNRKLYSEFLRICWKPLRVITPKQKDEICLNGKVKIVMNWAISRELANSLALNDYRVTASKASA